MTPPPSMKTNRNPRSASSVQDFRRVQTGSETRQADDFRVADALAGPRQILRAEQQGRGGSIVEDAVAALQPAVGIHHHPYRIVAGAMAHGQLGIVVPDRAGSDQNRIGQGPHAVVMQDILRPRDPLGSAAQRRDTPVQALAQMGDGIAAAGGSGAERKVEIAQEALIGIERTGASPGTRLDPAFDQGQQPVRRGILATPDIEDGAPDQIRIGRQARGQGWAGAFGGIHFRQ